MINGDWNLAIVDKAATVRVCRAGVRWRSCFALRRGRLFLAQAKSPAHLCLGGAEAEFVRR